MWCIASVHVSNYSDTRSSVCFILSVHVYCSTRLLLLMRNYSEVVHHNLYFPIKILCVYTPVSSYNKCRFIRFLRINNNTPENYFLLLLCCCYMYFLLGGDIAYLSKSAFGTYGLSYYTKLLLKLTAGVLVGVILG